MAVVQNQRMNMLGGEDAPYLGCVALAGGAQSLTTMGRGLWITGTGNFTCTMQDGTTLAITGIAVGVYRITVRDISVCTATGYVMT